MLVSKDKYIGRWVDWEHRICDDEKASKTVHKDEEGDQ